MKQKIFQNIKIGILGVVTLLFAFLTVVELLPSGGSGLEIEEEVKVSSSLINVQDGGYVCAVTGAFFNPDGEDITVDSLHVTVKAVIDVTDTDGKTRRDTVEKEVELEGFTVRARTGYRVSKTWEDVVGFESVDQVLVTVKGETELLSYSETPINASAFVWFFLAGAILSALGLLRACRVRYYLYQEEQAQTAG